MSTELAINELFVISGKNLPSNGSDPSSGISYTSWAVDDAAQFTLILPREYQAGSKITLRFQESTPGASVNHKWQVTTTLASPLGALIDADDYVAISTKQITSPLTANQIQVTDHTIASSGVIDGSVARPGDILTFQLERIAASANEDSNEIKVIALGVILSIVGSTYANCPGQVGGVIDRLLERFNDRGMGFASPSIALGYINACQADLSLGGYWREWSDLSITEDEEQYDLLTLFPNFVDCLNVRWKDTQVKLVPAGSMSKFSTFRRMVSQGVPQVWLLDGNTLYITPTPESAGTLELFLSYTPPDRDCDTAYDLLTPRGYEEMYVNYALMKECQRQGMDDSRRANMAGDFAALWRQDKLRLLASRDRRGRRMRSYRG